MHENRCSSVCNPIPQVDCKGVDLVGHSRIGTRQQHKPFWEFLSCWTCLTCIIHMTQKLSQMCNTIYPKQWREELWKGPIASVSNSIFQPVEVVQPEGRNGDLHTFTYPQLCTPHHPWDGVTTGVHLQAKRPFPTGPSGPHCAFVPQWDPMPLQSPANHLLQRQSHLCRPRVNLWTHETLTARTPSTRAVTFPPLLLPKRSVSMSRLGPRLKMQLYQIPTFCSFPSVCSWTAWPDLPVQTCLFFFLTSNLHFSVAQYWMWILAGSISTKHYLSQWKPALWWNLLQEDNFCLLKRDPPCRHCTPWPPVKGQVCLAFPWYRFSRQGTIRPISSPTCPGLYQW